MRRFWMGLLAVALGLGCGPVEEYEDGDEPLALSEEELISQQRSVVAAVNDERTTATRLRAAGVAATTATQLVQRRNGADGRHLTNDDKPFRTYAELSKQPGVDAATLQKLQPYAETLGYKLSPAEGRYDGVDFTPEEAQQTLAMANKATAAELRSGAKLTATVATRIVNARQIPSMRRLADVRGVGTTAMRQLKAYAKVWKAPEQPKPPPPLWSSKRPGMGATLYNGGVTFRVWAPNATRVFVAGDFNGWNMGANELGNEFNGNFSGDIAGAHRWQKYKYVIHSKWGETLWKTDPRSARVTNSIGESVIHDPGAYHWQHWNFQIPPRNEMVVYEMHIGTYNDSPGFGPGNWRSAVAKLDHLVELGVNMVEVLPVNEFAGDFSWGYNPAFLFAPESAYGTPEDVKFFIDEAHKRGIGVLIDVVHNHYGPSDLSMWCFDGDCHGNGGIYFFTDWRADTPWGRSRPDYGRPQVRDFIKDSAMMWLNEYRADGLRFDATKWVRTQEGSSSIPEGYSLLQWINDEVDRTQPWKMIVAEDFGGDFVTRSTSSGGMGFDSQWSDFYRPLRHAAITQHDGDRNMNDVAAAIRKKYNGQATQRMIYTESHDEVANGQTRVPEMIWPGNSGSWQSKKRSTLAAGVMFTSPGIPMLFQGQEFLEDDHFTAENPLDWSRKDHFPGIFNMYRDMIRLRRNWYNNTRGLRGEHVNTYHVNNGEKVIAYHRWDKGGAGDDVVVVANFSGQPKWNYRVAFPRWGKWHLRFNSDWSGYSPDFGNTATYAADAVGTPWDGMAQSATVNIGPYTVLIFSQ